MDMDVELCRFLIVDDHFLMRSIVMAELKRMGAKSLSEASDGLIALQKIKEATEAGTPFHVIFLDWTMPNANGFDVLTACRADKRLDKTAIVMLSSESEKISIIKALEAGATAYITKPFKSENFCKKIADVLNWRRDKKEDGHD